MTRMIGFSGVCASLFATLALSVVAQASPTPPASVPAAATSATVGSGSTSDVRLTAKPGTYTIGPTTVVVKTIDLVPNQVPTERCPNGTKPALKSPGSKVNRITARQRNSAQDSLDVKRLIATLARENAPISPEDGGLDFGKVSGQINNAGAIYCLPADFKSDEQLIADKVAAKVLAAVTPPPAPPVVVTTPPVEAPKAEPAPAAVAAPVTAPKAAPVAKKNELSIPVGAGSGTVLSKTSTDYAKGAVDTVLYTGVRYHHDRLRFFFDVAALGSHVDFLPRGTADKGFVFITGVDVGYDIGKRVTVGGGAWYGLTRALLDDQAYNATNGAGVDLRICYDLGQLELCVKGGPGGGVTAQPGRIGLLNKAPIDPIGLALATLRIRIPIKSW